MFRCDSVTVRHIEFKYFKPKYIDGTHFFPQMARMSVSINIYKTT